MDRGGDRPLTHAWIWSAIDSLARRHDLTPSGLARLAGLDPTAFNRSKRFTPEGRPRWPSTESIAKVLQATGTSLDEFTAIEFIDRQQASSGRSDVALLKAPIVGVIRNAQVDNWVPRIHRRIEPPAPRATGRPGERRFALAVADDSLEPVYSSGNTIVVSEAVAWRAGDRILIKPTGLPVLPRLLLSANSDGVEVGLLTGDAERLSLRPDDIEWMARIVLVRQ